MENIGLLKQFSMDHYLFDLQQAIGAIIAAKDDEKVMKEIGYIASESLKALYAYKRNHKDNDFIFAAVIRFFSDTVLEVRKNDERLAEMLGLKERNGFEIMAKLEEWADKGINASSKEE